MALIEMKMSTCNATATGVDTGPVKPPGFHLSSPYPNPISGSGSIDYSLDTAGPVTIALYDVRGQRMATLMSDDRGPGPGRLQIDLSNLATGVYFVKLKTQGKSVSRKIIVVR
jgi:hypothetical protein